MTVRKPWLATALAFTLSCTATAQVAILQIQILEGDRAVHAPGSRSAVPLRVQVTDESGRPAPGAAVTFHLPAEGPGGTFDGGLRTQIAITDANGRVAVRGLRLNDLSGAFQIRIVASKEQARAGVVSMQYVADARSGLAAKSRSGKRKWLAAVALVGGGVGAGLLAARRSGPTSAAPAPPAIGSPTISVGQP